MLLVIKNTLEYTLGDGNMRDLQLSFISNRTTSRLFRILSIIERSRLFTIGELAKKIQVTERTIASDVKYMRDYFGESIKLSSGNSGIMFVEKKPSIYQKLKQQLLKNECLFEIVGNIFYGRFANVDELADRYHFSESAFRRMLKKSNKELKTYDLQWASNPLTIEGAESNLRKFFKDFYYEGIDTEYTVRPDQELIDLLGIKLEGMLETYSIGSGTTPAAFYYTFFIAIKRTSLGFVISLPEDLKSQTYTEVDFAQMFELKSSIEQLYKISVSKEEFAWIYLVNLCKRRLYLENHEQRFYDHFHQGEAIELITDAFLDMYVVPTKTYPTIKTFMKSYFLSRYINYRISPVLNKEMNDLKDAVFHFDQEAYQKNYEFLKERALNLLGTSPYLEDVSVSLTIYSGLILDIYTPSKIIYFLLEGDHFIYQYIRTRVIQRFGAKHIIKFLPLQYLTEEVLDNADVDLIVTNYSRYVLDHIVSTDYLLLKEVPDEQDWQKLEKIIDPYRKKLI